MGWRTYVDAVVRHGRHYFYLQRVDDDLDGPHPVLPGMDGRLGFYTSEPEARAAAELFGERPAPKTPYVDDMDAVHEWAVDPRAESVDYALLMHTWHKLVHMNVLEEMPVELTCDRPSAYFAVPEAERDARTFTSEGLTIIDPSSADARFFVRAVIVIPVRGEHARDGFGWGAWAEVSRVEFGRLVEAGDEPDREKTAPLVGTLANELTPFPGSHGLPVHVLIQSPELAPSMIIMDEAHPLGSAQRGGVFHEDVLEWLHSILH
jgi:hypothetical protein